MHTNFLTLISLLSALTSATALPDPNPAADANALTPRDETKAGEGDFSIAACQCRRVSNPGLYCGFCKVAAGTGVGPGNQWVNTVPLDNVAWCNTAGGCEDYGYSSHCRNREAQGCRGLDRWP